MRKIILILLPLIVFANSNDKVIELKVNNKIKYFDSKNITLKEGDVVCYYKGKLNTLVIKFGNKYKKNVTKNNCEHLVVKKSFFDKTIKNLVKIAKTYIETNEKMVAGSGTRGIKGKKENIYKKDIILTNKDTFLAIENDTWTPPVTLTLQDNNGKTIKTLTNEEDLLTSFILPKSILKNGYKVMVKDGLDDIVVDAKIVIK